MSCIGLLHKIEQYMTKEILQIDDSQRHLLWVNNPAFFYPDIWKKEFNDNIQRHLQALLRQF